MAAQNGHLAVLKVLLAEMGPAVALNRAKRDGVTALYMACKNGHLLVARWLVQHGADVKKSFQNLENPLFIARQEGYMDVVRTLIEAGSNVDTFPLHIACHNGHLLHVAKDGNFELVEQLLESGADPMAWWKLAKAAMDLAKEEEERAGNEAAQSSSSSDAVPIDWAAIARRRGASCVPAFAA